jgi:tRNA(fMet)-specific endonuclease VapC
MKNGTSHPSFLIDTVAAIAQLNNDVAILPLFTAMVRVSIPIIVVAELYAGAEHSGRVEANIQRTDKYLDGANILFCDLETARRYGKIVQMLSKKGRPIPQNDMWIAALALQHQLTLVTRDAHFNQIDGLGVKGW